MGYGAFGKKNEQRNMERKEGRKKGSRKEEKKKRRKKKRRKKNNQTRQDQIESIFHTPVGSPMRTPYMLLWFRSF